MYSSLQAFKDRFGAKNANAWVDYGEHSAVAQDNRVLSALALASQTLDCILSSRYAVPGLPYPGCSVLLTEYVNCRAAYTLRIAPRGMTGESEDSGLSQFADYIEKMELEFSRRTISLIGLTPHSTAPTASE
jgi:phage gp36-like protein